jgi:hypothetical protein
VRVGLLLVSIFAIAESASAQPAEPRRVHFLAQAGRGGGWLALGAQVDVAVASRLRISPDVLIGEGGAVASVSALYGPDSDRPQRLGLYGGVGGGVYSVEDILEPALFLRAGVEVPLTSRRLSLRVEGRESLSKGNATFFMVAALRVP